MHTVSQIQNKITEGSDRIEAILQVAEEENRELTEDEQKEVDTFHGAGDDLGEYGKLQQKLDQAKKIEARRKTIVSNRLGGKLSDHVEESDNDSGLIKVPARARRHGAIAAFGSGESAQRDAYVSGQFILAKLLKHQPAQKFLDDHGIKSAMSTGAATLGAEVIPEPLEAAIVRIVEENGVLRQMARPVTMVSGTHKIPNRVSGLTVYYPDENASITPSDMTLDQIPVAAKKYATLTKVSSELTEDSIVSIANELAIEIGLAFALAEDTNGFLGDGTAAFASVTGLNSKLLAGSKVTGAGTLANFEATAAKLPKFGGSMPAWYCNSAVYHGTMVPLMNASGGTPGSQIASGYDAMFLGYPVRFVQAMPAAAAAGDASALFGTLSQAVYMGTRRGITIAQSSEFYFGDDAIAVKGTERVGITVENQDSATAAGPVVGLFAT